MEKTNSSDEDQFERGLFVLRPARRKVLLEGQRRTRLHGTNDCNDDKEISECPFADYRRMRPRLRKRPRTEIIERPKNVHRVSRLTPDKSGNRKLEIQMDG